MKNDIIENIIKIGNEFVEQFQNTFLSKHSFIQFLILLLLVIVSFPIVFILNKIIKQLMNKKKNLFNRRIGKLVFFTTYLILNSITIYIFKSNDHAVRILELVNNLIFAYVAMHLISIVTQKSGLSKVIYRIVWVLVVLNILGLYSPLLNILDSFAIEFGETKVSILLIIKGFVVLLLSTWLSLKISNVANSFVDKSERLNPTLKVLISKIIKITIVTTSILLALSFIGIKLTAFALFGSAIGVGIGFGLQKIVSNLMSGFILLFDKSVKPGDVIAIDDTFGWIKSMAARYITVTTIEGKEHLIPNEDLITHKVINWSHSNKRIRVNVDVGVSYNADIPKALKIVKESAKSNSRVLKDPQPVALLVGFGDSSIDLQLKFWITDPEKGIDNIKSDIYLYIWEKFKEENIEIPFPQTDVHIITKKEEN